ncbi:MAG: lipoyl(octanoyl) transferase LipB [Miltoncostaeaceae bacterium]
MSVLAPGREAIVVRTSRMDYRAAWEVQRSLVARRGAGEIPDVLWLLEHPPTFTTGRHGDRGDLLLDDAALAERGGAFVRSDRGGQMTWHGPGQMTAYVIADLRPGGRVRAFVDALVEAMRAAAGVADAHGDGRAVGLYVDGRKLGSVGIRVSEGISHHGVALNRDPDLEWPRAMVGCGDPGVPPTSIAAEGGDPDRDRVEDAFVSALGEGLGWARLDAGDPDGLGIGAAPVRQPGAAP